MDLLEAALVAAALRIHLVQAPAQEAVEGNWLQQLDQQFAAARRASLWRGSRLYIPHLPMLGPRPHTPPGSLCCSTSTSCSPPAYQDDHCSRQGRRGSRQIRRRVRGTCPRYCSEPPCESSSGHRTAPNSTSTGRVSKVDREKRQHSVRDLYGTSVYAPEAECRSSHQASHQRMYTRTCPVPGQCTRHRSGTGSTRTHRSQQGAGTPQAAEDRKASGTRRRRRSRCSPPHRDSWPGTGPRARRRCSTHSGARARGCERAGRLTRAIPCPKRSQPWRAVASPARRLATPRPRRPGPASSTSCSCGCGSSGSTGRLPCRRARAAAVTHAGTVFHLPPRLRFGVSQIFIQGSGGGY
jgi:hypothetical protein